MLLGNAGVITAVSSLIISFVNVEDSGKVIFQVFLIITGVVVIWWLAGSRWLDMHLNNLISKLLKRYKKLNVQDYAKQLHLAGDYQITEIQTKKGDWLSSKKLGQLKLRDEGMIVLGITRKAGDFLGVPDGETAINPEDILIIYGRAENLEALDTPREGTAGNKDHDESIRKQKRIKQIEKLQDGQDERQTKK